MSSPPPPLPADVRTPSRSSWDPDERPAVGGSKWDMPSPALSRDSGILTKPSKDTPLPTPTYRYNVWADDRKSLGITPKPKGEGKLTWSPGALSAAWGFRAEPQ